MPNGDLFKTLARGVGGDRSIDIFTEKRILVQVRPGDRADTITATGLNIQMLWDAIIVTAPNASCRRR